MTAPHARLLDELRPPTFAIAYRMLGSVGEAEDIVQEVLLRMHRTLQEGQRIDGYDEIAEIVGTSEANARQLATRARRHVQQRRPRFEAVREQRDELARRFFAAAQDGDLDALEALLSEDVVLRGDGGGKVPALAASLHGRRRVAQTLIVWARQGLAFAGGSFRRVEVNGQPGALGLDRDGGLVSVMALDIADGQIQGVSSIVNPDKIGHLGRVGDMRALLKRR